MLLSERSQNVSCGKNVYLCIVNSCGERVEKVKGGCGDLLLFRSSPSQLLKVKLRRDEQLCGEQVQLMAFHIQCVVIQGS